MRYIWTIVVTLFVTVPMHRLEAKTYFIHADHLNTPQMMTDENQDVVWKADYNPFGEATVDEDPDGDGKMVTNNLRFPGQYFDEETGLHYNKHRYYDPGIGRYITSDPIGLDGGLNTYGYVSGNPIRYTDPTGEAICGGICIGVGLGILALWNYYDTLNDVVDTAETLSDECSTAGDKFGALAFLALGIVDPTPGNLGKRLGKNIDWKFGKHKKETKWQNQMKKRGWSEQQISEAIENGQQFKAENLINKGNSATRYIHPRTGKSVVVDDVTDEIIHVGGEGFRY